MARKCKWRRTRPAARPVRRQGIQPGARMKSNIAELRIRTFSSLVELTQSVSVLLAMTWSPTRTWTTTQRSSSHKVHETVGSVEGGALRGRSEDEEAGVAERLRVERRKGTEAAPRPKPPSARGVKYELLLGRTASEGRRVGREPRSASTPAPVMLGTRSARRSVTGENASSVEFERLRAG